MKKRLISAVATIALLAVFVGCGDSSASEGQDADKSQVVATLDECTVTLADYEYYYRAYQNNMEMQAMSTGYTEDNIQEFWDMEQDGTSNRQMLADNALTMAKQYRVLIQAAATNGSQASEEALSSSDADVDNLLAEYNNDEAAFFEAYRMTPDELREMYHQFDLINQYQEDVLADVEVSQEEIEEAYEANKAAYEEQVTVRHVLISSSASMSEEDQAAAKAKAEDILAQLEGGAEIGALAAEYSEDPGSKDNNGEYTFGRGQMVEPFEEWSFSAQPGDHGIVQTDYGYHVMEMVGPADQEIFKEQIRESLANEKAMQIINEVAELAESEDWEVNQELVNQIQIDSETN